MLFKMYETYQEKVAPDVYNGYPIMDKDDLIHAVEDAAGYELAGIVAKYLDKCERQANTAMYIEAGKVGDAEVDKLQAEDDLKRMERMVDDVAADLADELVKQRLSREKLCGVLRKMRGIVKR